MLRLLIDENFPPLILRAVKSRLPELDFVSVHQVGLQDHAYSRFQNHAAFCRRVNAARRGNGRCNCRAAEHGYTPSN